MKMMGFNEIVYLLKNLRQVKHTTLNPYGPGVVRIHMIPPKFSFDKSVPGVIILNGQDILPINISWVILLSCFIDILDAYDGAEIHDEDWDSIACRTIADMRKIYRRVDEQTLKDDLWKIIGTLTDIARGVKPDEDIGIISIGSYARYMKAPHRMDLMISSMAGENGWNCNQRCLHCYAAGQKLSAVSELSTHQWKAVIDKCRNAGIPQITFTGGEPTMRDDLVELVEYSRWFVTRLNTNGVRLNDDLCGRLYDASLDSVQITLYSSDPAVHNRLVGADNWEHTVSGIRSALQANLNVSVNTPLCKNNSDFVSTLRFINQLSVRYVSCSGLIPTGNAQMEKSIKTQLTGDELADLLREAFGYCGENHMELSFTSPGWVDEQRLLQIGLPWVPSCGACLSNMAVAPDGQVIPCQSWLSEDALGNMLTDPWNKIWNSAACRKIREESAKMEQICQLRRGGQENTL